MTTLDLDFQRPQLGFSRVPIYELLCDIRS